MHLKQVLNVFCIFFHRLKWKMVLKSSFVLTILQTHTKTYWDLCPFCEKSQLRMVPLLKDFSKKKKKRNDILKC